jgi:ABC-2 type transport system ATP-binding protein
MEVPASLQGVHRRFGAVAALDGLNLEGRRGELLALLGSNGAGKTTAISLRLGLQQPDEGTSGPVRPVAARCGRGAASA